MWEICDVMGVCVCVCAVWGWVDVRGTGIQACGKAVSHSNLPYISTRRRNGSGVSAVSNRGVS